MESKEKNKKVKLAEWRSSCAYVYYNCQRSKIKQNISPWKRPAVGNQYYPEQPHIWLRTIAWIV